jgi:hypothetical protein
VIVIVGQGQLALARELARGPAPGSNDVGVVGAQDLAGGLGQVELHLAVLHRHQLRQRMGVVFQRAVKRLVGQALRHQPGQRQAHGHSSSSGVSIQSRISPNSERCSRWKIFTAPPVWRFLYRLAAKRLSS